MQIPPGLPRSSKRCMKLGVNLGKWLLSANPVIEDKAYISQNICIKEGGKMYDFPIVITQNSGLIVGIIGVIIALFTLIKSRRKKSLEYRIISDTLIFETENLEDQMKEHLRVFYGQKEVKNISLLEVKFTNNGDFHIAGDDFKKPLSIEFNQGARILGEIEIKDSDPKDLLIRSTVTAENKAEIIPDLMNPKEWFVLKLLVAENSDYDIDARIAGIKKLTGYEPPMFSMKILLIASLSAISSAFLTDFIVAWTEGIFQQMYFTIRLISFLLLYIVLAFSLIYFLENITKRRRF